MRIRMNMIAVLAIVAATVACGDEGTSKETTEPTTTWSTTQLEAMLLGEGDVGEYWKIGEDITPEDLSSFAQVPCEDTAVNPTIAERLTADTAIQFEPTDGSYKHIMEMLVTGDSEQLDADLQAYFDAAQSCITSPSTTPTTGTMTIDEFTIPELGDQRVAGSMSALESPESERTWYVRSATVRVGSVAVGLGLTEILSTPQDKPQISDEEFVRILEAAVAKLSG